MGRWTRVGREDLVPAGNKWFARVVVAAAIVQTLNSLHLENPEVSLDKHFFMKRLELKCHFGRGSCPYRQVNWRSQRCDVVYGRLFLQEEI